MKNRGLASMIRDMLILMAALAACRVASGTDETLPDERLAGPKMPALREELLSRAAKDQEARRKLVERMRRKPGELAAEKPAWLKELRKIDADNRKWLKSVVTEHGWPGRTLVGTDGAHVAFLLVQHASEDLPFQKHCLKLMRRLPKGEVAPADIAYLVDRTRLAEGKRQVYGTQVEVRDGRWVACDVEDPDRLDQRREEVGLPPMDVYLKAVQQLYGLPTLGRDDPNRGEQRRRATQPKGVR